MSDVALKMSGRESVSKPLTRKSDLGRSSGWYGVWWIIASEGSLFAYLLFSYYYCLLQADQKWPVGGLPSLMMPVATTVLLIGSSLALAAGQWSIGRYGKRRLLLCVAICFVLGAGALIIQTYDLAQRAPGMARSTYDSFYVLLAALDVLHAFAGVIALAALLTWVKSDLLIGIRGTYIAIVAAYWHFTVVVWLTIFATLTVLPYVS